MVEKVKKHKTCRQIKYKRREANPKKEARMCKLTQKHAKFRFAVNWNSKRAIKFNQSANKNLLKQANFKKAPKQATRKSSKNQQIQKNKPKFAGKPQGWQHCCKSSRRASFSTVNYTSVTSYNCHATITFFSIAQQWTTSDATTINISFLAINCTQPPVQLTGLLGVWMRHGDLKIFMMTHQHTEARNNFPWKNEEPLKLTWPHYMFCGTLAYHGIPVEEYWARLYFYTYMEIHFDEHKSYYTLIRFTQKCFSDPTKRFCSQVQNLRALTKA